MKKIVVLIYLCNSFFVYSADKVPQGVIDFAMHALTLFPIGTVLSNNRVVVHKKNTNFVIDVDGHEIQQDTYAHSTLQRKEAQPHYEGAVIGTVAQIISDPVINFPVSVIAPVCRLRKEISVFAALEQSLLPAACYAELKKLVVKAMPHVDNKVQSSIALAGAISLSHMCVLLSGASPERLALNALMYHMFHDQHTKCMHVAYVRHAMQSLSYASKVMPLVQMGIGIYNRKPNMLTLYPTFYEMGGINKSAEYMHGVLPALVLAGVDVTFNMVAATSVGKTVETGVDLVLDFAVKPLPEQIRTRTKRGTKKALAEATKIGTTVALVSAAEAQGCVVQ